MNRFKTKEQQVEHRNSNNTPNWTLDMNYKLCVKHNSSGLREKCRSRIYKRAYFGIDCSLAIRGCEQVKVKLHIHIVCSTYMVLKLLSRNRRNTDMCFLAIGSSVEPHICNRKKVVAFISPHFLLLLRNLSPQLYDISNHCD